MSKVDVEKLARRLGAARHEPVKARSGYFGAMELLADVQARFGTPPGPSADPPKPSAEPKPRLGAREFLLRVRRAPHSWASTKEGLALTVLSALMVDGIEIPIRGPGNSFLARHVGSKGNCIVGLRDPYEDEWAHAVVDDALSFIK
jgi:hypothetical protein